VSGDKFELATGQPFTIPGRSWSVLVGPLPEPTSVGRTLSSSECWYLNLILDQSITTATSPVGMAANNGTRYLQTKLTNSRTEDDS
jgi:hypothetical protein